MKVPSAFSYSRRSCAGARRTALYVLTSYCVPERLRFRPPHADELVSANGANQYRNYCNGQKYAYDERYRRRKVGNDLARVGRNIGNETGR